MNPKHFTGPYKRTQTAVPTSEGAEVDKTSSSEGGAEVDERVRYIEIV